MVVVMGVGLCFELSDANECSQILDVVKPSCYTEKKKKEKMC